MAKHHEYAVDGVARYVAASLSKAARESAWPDDAPGNAVGLLVRDLGEFAEAMVACAVAGYWSPAKAFERLYLERIEVLMGAVADPNVGRRYLDSVLAEPKGFEACIDCSTSAHRPLLAAGPPGY